MECQECAALLKEAMDAVQAHVHATSRISNAVIMGFASAIPELEKAVEVCRDARLHAMKRYQDHRATHSQSASSAGTIGA